METTASQKGSKESKYENIESSQQLVMRVLTHVVKLESRIAGLEAEVSKANMFLREDKKKV